MTLEQIRTYLNGTNASDFTRRHGFTLMTIMRIKSGKTIPRPTTVMLVAAAIEKDKRRARKEEEKQQQAMAGAS